MPIKIIISSVRSVWEPLLSSAVFKWFCLTGALLTMAIANSRLSPARFSFLCQYLQATIVLKHNISKYARRWHTQFFGYKRSCFLILTGGLLLDPVQLKSDRVRSCTQSDPAPSLVLKLDPVQFLSWTQSYSHPVTTTNSCRTLDWEKN